MLTAAKERNHPPEHILFYGPPGLGKTTLAHLVAKDMNCQMKITSGPAIEKIGDLASILTNLSPGDMLFIDEIHRLNKTIEEVLYPAMESGSLDIIIGKGPSARTIQLELPPFTLIGATTRIAMISSPLRSRFSGGIFKLEFYTNSEIEKIISRSAKILGVEIKQDTEIKDVETPDHHEQKGKIELEFLIQEKIISELPAGQSLPKSPFYIFFVGHLIGHLAPSAVKVIIMLNLCKFAPNFTQLT